MKKKRLFLYALQGFTLDFVRSNFNFELILREK